MSDRTRSVDRPWIRDGAVEVLDRAYSSFPDDDRSRSILIDRIIVRLGRNLSLEEQRQVLLDLSQIGLADRKFLHSEATFIHHVSEVWSVHRAEGLDESWSILGQGGIQGEALHGLALQYLVVSIGPDGEISDAEREVISRQLFQWIPDADSEDIDSALRSALATFSLKSIGEITSEAVQSVRRLIPSHQFLIILSDLNAIACADHVMSVEERIWIQRLSKALEN